MHERKINKVGAFGKRKLHLARLIEKKNAKIVQITFRVKHHYRLSDLRDRIRGSKWLGRDRAAREVIVPAAQTQV